MLQFWGKTGGTIFVPFFVREVERQILGEIPRGSNHFGEPVYVRIEKV